MYKRMMMRLSGDICTGLSIYTAGFFLRLAGVLFSASCNRPHQILQHCCGELFRSLACL